MKFSFLGNRFSRFASHPFALALLLLLSLLEACVSPLSPLVLLVPMSLAQPQKAWRYVALATLAASVGAIIGYGIGYFSLQATEQIINELGHADTWQQATLWFEQWGVVMLLISSIFPIPFKLFTLLAGASQFSLPLFIGVVVIARGLHFALIPLAMSFAQKAFERYAARFKS